MDLYRKLAEARPDAFMPDLAIVLWTHNRSLAAMERTEDAREAIEEAIRILLPFFERLPNAYGGLLVNMLHDYRERCSALHLDPDPDLLPLLEALDARKE